jgi:hypothetical protein
MAAEADLSQRINQSRISCQLSSSSPACGVFWHAREESQLAITGGKDVWGGILSLHQTTVTADYLAGIGGQLLRPLAQPTSASEALCQPKTRHQVKYHLVCN